jgi:hypothetical protein
VSIHVTFNEGIFPMKRNFEENPLEHEDGGDAPLFANPDPLIEKQGAPPLHDTRTHARSQNLAHSQPPIPPIPPTPIPPLI